jgi:hypothetical protein
MTYKSIVKVAVEAVRVIVDAGRRNFDVLEGVHGSVGLAT